MKRENHSNNEDDSSQNGESNHGSNNGGSGGGGGGGGGNQGGRKRFRGNDENVRLLIPSRIAGAIIGKGGQHINRLRSEFKATINVEDCQGPERTVHISAELDNAIGVVEEMLKNFDEKEEEYDIRMLIHQSLAGCVIGKGGSKIKEIRDKIGCRILKVFSNVCPQSSDRVVQCVGKSEHCVESVREILELVKEVPIKGPVQNYDPINYDDMFADKYGGFGENSGGGGGGGGGGNNGGGGNGRNGGNFRDGGGDRFNRGGGGRGDDRGGFDRRGGGDMGGRRNDRRDNMGGGGGRGGMRDNNRDFIDPWAPNAGPIGGNNGGGGNGGGGGGFGGLGGGNFGNFGGGNMGGGNMGGGGGMGGGNMGGGFGGVGNNGGNQMGGGLGNLGGGGVGVGGNQMGGIGGGMGGGLGGGNFGGVGGLGGNLGGGGGGGNMGGGNNGGNIGNFGGNNGGNVGGGGGGNGGPGDDKSTTQVTIPKDLAGAIIGKAGGRIRRIRMESNAFITIDEPLPGSTDRIITITGSPKQIQMAQYLLQQSVHEHKRNDF